MFGRPKISITRLWVEPSIWGKTNGDRPRSLAHANKERQANIKLATFFAVIALLFVLAEHLGRVEEKTDAKFAPDSAALVSLSLSPPEKSGNGTTFSVRFRLSNRGNHSVFYEVNAETGTPVGQLVARASGASEWVSIFGASNMRLPAAQDLTDGNLAWIEMPPGGWVDGVFPDTGRSQEKHAYLIYVKPTRDGKGLRILSTSYVLPPT